MVKSIVPISGLFDLEPIRLTSLDDAVCMDPKTAKHNSPLFMLPTIALPVTVVVGGGETDELRRQSREFTDAWRGKVSSIEHIVSPGHDHFSVIETLVEPDNLLTSVLLRHLDLKT